MKGTPMNNYLVQYKNYMLPTGRQFSISGVVISFTKEKTVIDVLKEVERQTKLSSDNNKLRAKVNDVYSSLIANYKCEPYMSMENAKNAILDIRNDEILNSMQLKKDQDVEKLRLELANKLTSMRQAMEKESEELEAKLQTELQESIGEVNKDESLIVQADKQLKEGELPIADQIKIREQIAQTQQRTEAHRSKLTRQLASISSKVDQFKKSKEKDMTAVEVEYNKMINDLKKKSEKEILDKAMFLSERKALEIKLIDDILKFKEAKNEKTIDVETKDVKDILVETPEKETIKEKAKVDEKKPAKK